MSLDLTPREAELVREVLVSHLKEMTLEIARTDTHEVRDLLRQEYECLDSVRKRIEAATDAQGADV